MLLTNLSQDRVIDKSADMVRPRVQLVLVPEGGVVRDMDALRLVPVGKIMLLQPRVAFELVYGRLDGGILDETLHFGLVKVGDADGFCLSGGD